MTSGQTYVDEAGNNPGLEDQQLGEEPTSREPHFDGCVEVVVRKSGGRVIMDYRDNRVVAERSMARRGILVVDCWQEVRRKKVEAIKI